MVHLAAHCDPVRKRPANLGAYLVGNVFAAGGREIAVASINRTQRAYLKIAETEEMSEFWGACRPPIDHLIARSQLQQRR